MSQIEKFISKNREAFDQEVPPLRVWAKLDRALEDQGRQRSIGSFPLRRFLSMAAAVAVLIGAGVLVGFFLSENGQTPVPALVQSEPALPPAYREAEDYYRHQYQEKVSQLANYPIDPGFEKDLIQFEQVMQTLKTELQKAPKGNEERIVQAIIQHYQLKIDILQRVLDRIQTTHPKTANESNDEISL